MFSCRFCIPVFLIWSCLQTCGQPAFLLPTPNHALFETNGFEQFYVGTVGREWPSGTFGCVRSEGYQFHEGLDIRAVNRDKSNEPTDPIFATADGTVTYVNHKAGLSSYGKYIVLSHRLEGIEIFSLYAHLSEIGTETVPGAKVKAGQVIGVMGRTANTRQGISRDRAHLHFELCLLINDRFAEWRKEKFPDLRNDHGRWNGRNLSGIDPQSVLLQANTSGSFSILQHLRSHPELCRVFVKDTEFPWLWRYRPLIRRNPVAEKEGIIGYEVSLSYNGTPLRMIPRAASEVQSSSRYELLHVDDAMAAQYQCSDLVDRVDGKWKLSRKTTELLDLLTY